MENYTDHNTDPTIEPIRRLIETMGATAVGLSPESDALQASLQEEQRLVEEVAHNNDAEALALLYEDYRNYLLAVVHGVTHLNPWLMKDAEDYLQSTFVKAFTTIDSFTSGSHPKAVRSWLAQILRRTVFDEIRAWRNSHTTLIDTRQEYIEDPDYLFMHEPPDPLEVAALREEVDEVVAILNEVLGNVPMNRGRTRRIMYMAFFEESTPNEIAAKLGVSVGVVKGVLQRARQALRKEVGGRD
jgi:RNA polymerase sigma factor (sigma-70 family)